MVATSGGVVNLAPEDDAAEVPWDNVSKRTPYRLDELTGLKADAFGLGLNDVAFTFNLEPGVVEGLGAATDPLTEVELVSAGLLDFAFDLLGSKGGMAGMCMATSGRLGWATVDLVVEGAALVGFATSPDLLGPPLKGGIWAMPEERLAALLAGVEVARPT